LPPFPLHAFWQPFGTLLHVSASHALPFPIGASHAMQSCPCVFPLIVVFEQVPSPSQWMLQLLSAAHVIDLHASAPLQTTRQSRSSGHVTTPSAQSGPGHSIWQ
jgi:hypothetical protein